MVAQWRKRRAHDRKLPSGRIIPVRECWVFYEARQKGSQQKSRGYRRRCPKCGAEIITIHMKKGGWAHFEGGKGLERVLHPCLHRGRGLPSGRDPDTLDLFEEENDDDSTH